MKKKCTWKLMAGNNTGNVYSTECDATVFLALTGGGKPDKCPYCQKKVDTSIKTGKQK